MARRPKAPIERPVDEPITLREPFIDPEPHVSDTKPWSSGDTWLRGLFMLVFAVLVSFAVPILGLLAVVQFFWMLFAGEKNEAVAEFGGHLSAWLADVGRFGTGISDEKPFPWKRLG
ncbi:MAG: DUF4389 domain-containing protein [Deltaproteobacteria bacterium]